MVCFRTFETLTAPCLKGIRMSAMRGRHKHGGQGLIEQRRLIVWVSGLRSATNQMQPIMLIGLIGHSRNSS